MANSSDVAAARAKLAAAGMGKDDLDWLDSQGWNDAYIPALSPSEVDAYKRREAALNASIAELSVTERGASLQGRLAAAIGARLADLRDKDEVED